MELQFRGVQLKPEDYIAAQRLHMCRKVITVGIVIFITLSISALVLTNGSIFDSTFWMVLLGWMLWLVVICVDRLLLLPWRCRRTFAQQKTLHQVSDKTINEEGLAVSSTYGSARIPWRDYYKWKSNDQLVLVYQSNRIFNMFPRRWFGSSEEYQAFQGVLARQIGPMNKAKKPAAS